MSDTDKYYIISHICVTTTTKWSYRSRKQTTCYKKLGKMGEKEIAWPTGTKLWIRGINAMFCGTVEYM